MELNPQKCRKVPIYEIVIKGHLTQEWCDWFGSISISLKADGNTLLRGSVADQAALYGLLKKLNQLGLQLISINVVEPDNNYKHN